MSLPLLDGLLLLIITSISPYFPMLVISMILSIYSLYYFDCFDYVSLYMIVDLLNFHIHLLMVTISWIFDIVLNHFYRLLLMNFIGYSDDIIYVFIIFIQFAIFCDQDHCYAINECQWIFKKFW